MKSRNLYCGACGWKEGVTKIGYTKVNIHSYTNTIFFKPKIKVIQSNKILCELSKDETQSIEIKQDKLLVFKSLFKSKIVDLSGYDNLEIYLSWDRKTGQLIIKTIG